MKVNIYSIFDTVAEVFNKPFTEFNDASAQRAFIASLEEKLTNKNDYVLYNIGTYDDSKGEIVGCNPVKVCSGFDKTNNLEVVG